MGIGSNGHLYATFGEDDFESWWLAGMTRSDPVSAANQDELYENCVYLANAEGREMSQSEEELRKLIEAWADKWNQRLGGLMDDGNVGDSRYFAPQSRD